MDYGKFAPKITILHLKYSFLGNGVVDYDCSLSDEDEEEDESPVSNLKHEGYRWSGLWKWIRWLSWIWWHGRDMEWVDTVAILDMVACGMGGYGMSGYGMSYGGYGYSDYYSSYGGYGGYGLGYSGYGMGFGGLW